MDKKDNLPQEKIEVSCDIEAECHTQGIYITMDQVFGAIKELRKISPDVIHREVKIRPVEILRHGIGVTSTRGFRVYAQTTNPQYIENKKKIEKIKELEEELERLRHELNNERTSK